MIPAALYGARFRLQIVWKFVWDKKLIRRKLLTHSGLKLIFSGKTGIRTLGARKGTTVFETAPIDHSGILPVIVGLFCVPGPGIEPGWIAPPVFETGASTDSAIRANAFQLRLTEDFASGP